jgi:hypothetical protein
MKAYRAVHLQLYVFLFSAVYGDEWLALRSDRYFLGERAPSTYWTEAGWTQRRSERRGGKR